MLPGGRGIDGLDRLDVRLVLLLGLALLPIGIIAMVQTYRVIDNADTVAREALIGTTITAVNAERERLLQLRGASQSAAEFLPSLLDDIDACSDRMAKLATRYAQVTFAGYIDISGIVRCGSRGVGQDVSDRPIYTRFSSEPSPFISSVIGVISQIPVIVVVQPVQLDGAVQGYIALSVPQMPLDISERNEATMRPLATMILSQEGELLSRSGADDAAAIRDFSPDGTTFRSLLQDRPYNVETVAENGIPAIYSVVPMIPGEVYGVAVWRAATVSTGGLTAASAILFPLLMWAVSIGVAYFAVHRLVVRHIRRLRLRIRAFTTSRRIMAPMPVADLPSELREVIESFEQMTDRIVRDEADLENSLHEKDVLLKEVHHRVKNNLQLVSSMMNMQMRKSKSKETRDLLHRLQERILGLATIHRNLYRADVLSRVETDDLLHDLVNQVVDPTDRKELGIKLDVDVAPVALYPDQAVPLSLLVTEALTNAVKYVGRPKSGPPWITLRVSADDGQVSLACRNSLGTPVAHDQKSLSSGLGSQLIEAFVMQLDGTLEQKATDDSYGVHLTFHTSNFAQEP